MTKQAEDLSGQPCAITVYLLDDHEIARRGIKDLLEREKDMVVVGESGAARDATREIPELQPDVAVLDARLPDGSGIDVCREIRSRDPSIKALILTSYDEDEALFAAIMAGAGGYVLKQVRGDLLVSSIRRVAAGEMLLDRSLSARVLEVIGGGPRADRSLQRLTRQEHRILALIGDGMTNRQIADTMHLAEKTVKNYVSSMLAKLSLESRTQAAIFVLRHPQGEWEAAPPADEGSTGRAASAAATGHPGSEEE